MIKLTDFARFGCVSIASLRRYDELGLLIPTRINRVTGCRWYEIIQLGRLNWIVALEGVGLTIQHVARILDEGLTIGELDGMLILRRAELQNDIVSDPGRLAKVEAHIALIRNEQSPISDEVMLKQIAPVAVVELSDIAASFEPEVLKPLVDRLSESLNRRLGGAGITSEQGQEIIYYESGQEYVRVHAALPVTDLSGSPARAGVPVVELNAAYVAAVAHKVSTGKADLLWQSIAYWLDRNEYEISPQARKVHLGHAGNDDDNLIELQQVVVPDARFQQGSGEVTSA